MTDWPEGTGRLDLGRVDSTNAHAIRLTQGLYNPLWITARSQRKGRGRSGRTWISEPGNFCATHVHRLDEDMSTAPRHSFVAALAVHDCLAGFVGDRCNLALKWPNDVLVENCKVAGILLECVASGGTRYIICGIGINLISSPADVSVPRGHPRPASLQEVTGVRLTADQVMGSLAWTMDARLEQYATHGFGSVRNDWIERAAAIGSEVEVRDGNDMFRGRLVTVDDEGHAVVDNGSEVRSFVAADIGMTGAR